MNQNYGIGLAGVIELNLPQLDSSFVLYPKRDALTALQQFLSWDFNCRLTLQVHTIAGLPSAFNGSGLLFHWEPRVDEDLVAGPTAVIEGVATFEEQLARTCFISCTRTGPYLSATYREEHFLIYASVDGQVGFDLGVHRIDLTDILAPMLEDNRQGRWNATYELQGEAAGADMNVSFEWLVLEDNPSPPPDSDNVDEPEINLNVPDEPPNDEQMGETNALQVDQDEVTTTNPQGPTTPPSLGDDSNNLVDDEDEVAKGNPRDPTTTPSLGDDNPTLEGRQIPSSNGRSPERPSPPTNSRGRPSSCCFGRCNLFKGCFF